MLIFRLAFKNIIGAGLRTWLSVLVLSFSYITIIFTQGMYRGMSQQITSAMIATELGDGQYWNSAYDPDELFDLDKANGVLPAEFDPAINSGQAVPILFYPGSIYPQGRLRPVIIKGIPDRQQVLAIPAQFLVVEDPEIVKAVIGERMANSCKLAQGDLVTLRWRDSDGTFDAVDVEIAHIMKTIVPAADQGILWLNLHQLQTMTGLDQSATMIVISPELTRRPDLPGWDFKSVYYLTEEIRAMVKMKSSGAMILYFVLIGLALIAIFDSQVLSIFHRRREMGTMMALGMTRLRLILLFTLEGAMHGVLAMLLAFIYGTPLLIWSIRSGIALPAISSRWGIALSDHLFPHYTIGLIVFTILLVMILVTVVSYLPLRRISRLKPTDALRGKLS